MKFWKRGILFCLGGGAYILLELLWRGYSHISMFFLGGLCFTLIGRLGELPKPLSLSARMLAGAGIITAGELAVGLMFNRDHHIWDYRAMPYHFLGQICLPFTLLWIPVSFGAVLIYRWAEGALNRK